MLGLALTSWLFLGAAPTPAPSPDVQFELGLGLGLAYDVVGLQFALRIRRFEAFTGLGPLTLFGPTITAGVRYLARSEPGWSFIMSLQGGSVWLHPGYDNEFGPRESIYEVSTIFGARNRFPSGWFTQFGLGPAVLFEDCQSTRNLCDVGEHVRPGASLEAGFGYAF